MDFRYYAQDDEIARWVVLVIHALRWDSCSHGVGGSVSNSSGADRMEDDNGMDVDNPFGGSAEYAVLGSLPDHDHIIG